MTNRLRFLFLLTACAGAGEAQNSDLGLLLGASVTSASVSGRSVSTNVSGGGQINYAFQLKETTAGRLYVELPLIITGVFAPLYRAGGDCIAGARSGSFPDAFFFSVQTLSTIGYGALSPRTDYANVIVTIEDRGPFVSGRILDLSKAAFRRLAPLGAGVVNVKATVLRHR